jgi:hypothetical protein
LKARGKKVENEANAGYLRGFLRIYRAFGLFLEINYIISKEEPSGASLDPPLAWGL